MDNVPMRKNHSISKSGQCKLKNDVRAAGMSLTRSNINMFITSEKQRFGNRKGPRLRLVNVVIQYTVCDLLLSTLFLEYSSNLNSVFEWRHNCILGRNFPYLKSLSVVMEEMSVALIIWNGIGPGEPHVSNRERIIIR